MLPLPNIIRICSMLVQPSNNIGEYEAGCSSFGGDSGERKIKVLMQKC